MSLNYPVLRHSGAHWWPDVCTVEEWGGFNPFSVCPVCGAASLSVLQKEFHYDNKACDPVSKLIRRKVKQSHIGYACGGVFMEMAEKKGFWSGRCGARHLLKQQVLQFTEDA